MRKLPKIFSMKFCAEINKSIDSRGNRLAFGIVAQSGIIVSCNKENMCLIGEAHILLRGLKVERSSEQFVRIVIY